MINFLQAENLSRRIGDLLLFNGLSITVNNEERVGIVAVNGAGKSTLLDIVTMREQPDTGSVIIRKGINIGYLRQSPELNDSLTVFDEIFSSDSPVLHLIRRYEEAAASAGSNELTALVQEMDDMKAWDFEVRIKQIISQLSLPGNDTLISTLSGGQRKRVALAKILIDDPDLLVLDEPTNHLDVEMAEWLENYLVKSGKAVILVTHDRYFLDNVCNVIYELSAESLIRYEGNYGYFLEKREERQSNEKASAEKARNLLRTELEWIRRMPKARSHKAKYRVEAFNELKNRSSAPREQKNVNINVSATRLGSKILTLDSVSKSFGERRVLSEFSYSFNKGARIGIVGPNGSGKSTLLNILTGSISPDTGFVDKGETVVFGYYRQEGISFDEDLTVIDAVRKIAETGTSADGRELNISQFLTYFLFPPSRQYTLIRKLSGGEKRRLYLLTVLITKPNFLLLDEPTNDLDILTLNVLEDYLATFNGCVIIVSHDRFFLDKISEYIFEVKDGVVTVFTGNYSRMREVRDAAVIAESSDNRNDIRQLKKPSSSAQTTVQSKRGLTYSEKREFEMLSKEIDILSHEKADLEEKLNGQVTNHEEIARLSARLGMVMSEIDEKELRWLELSEKA